MFKIRPLAIPCAIFPFAFPTRLSHLPLYLLELQIVLEYYRVEINLKNPLPLKRRGKGSEDENALPSFHFAPDERKVAGEALSNLVTPPLQLLPHRLLPKKDPRK